MTANQSDVAVLGGGCFWCVEAVFQQQAGVSEVTSGYAGGHTQSPTYPKICRGDTGHAEVIKVAFTPETVSYEALLDLFWRAHDPTTPNQQGVDKGTQYRSIILYTSDGQRATAEQSRATAQKHFLAPIVTEIAPLGEFWVAESEHQNFFIRNAHHPYCTFNILPKLEKLHLSK